MKTIHYPVRGRKLEETITQHTLDMLMTQMEDWQQAPGAFGRLNLHSCWSVASVLDRRYQGETVSIYSDMMQTVRTLFEKTGNSKWQLLENNMAAHLLYLQDATGGFIHATSEFEPTFDTSGCPIHFFNPVIALCEYYQWEHADEGLRQQIPAAVDRQWKWSLAHSWQAGNAHTGRLKFPGWCGVTNQDFTAVAALALTGKVFGNWTRYEEYGKPALDYYLSPVYYYKDIGLFERGDNDNFAERTPYYGVILKMLTRIFDATGDARVREVCDNIVDHLFDTVFVGADGMTYMARGAKTDPVDKSHVLGWEYGSIAFNSYPSLVTYMGEYLTRHPSDKRAKQVEALRSTIAGYMFENGNIPMGIFNPNPLFSIASFPDAEGLMGLVIDTLGDDLRDPQRVKIPAIHRQAGNLTWKQNGRLWAVEENGVRRFGGFTRYVAGITHGPDEEPVLGHFDSLDICDVLEILDD